VLRSGRKPKNIIARKHRNKSLSGVVPIKEEEKDAVAPAAIKKVMGTDNLQLSHSIKKGKAVGRGTSFKLRSKSFAGVCEGSAGSSTQLAGEQTTEEENSRAVIHSVKSKQHSQRMLKSLSMKLDSAKRKRRNNNNSQTISLDIRQSSYFARARQNKDQIYY